MKVVPKRRWRYPIALEREYTKRLTAFVEQNMTIIKQFLPDMAELLSLYAAHIDADNASLPSRLGILTDRIQARMHDAKDFQRVVENIYVRVSAYNLSEWEAIAKSVLGAPLRDLPFRQIQQDDEADGMLRELWVDDNLDLIRSVDEQTIQRIKNMLREKVMGNVARRELIQDLTAEIERIAGLEKNRAALIARDQVGKLNGQLTHYRQTNAGIEEYEWRSSHDQRVRPTHRLFDGHVYSWRGNPQAPEGPPGWPIRCRCVALPVIDLDKIVTKPVPGSYILVKQEYRPIIRSNVLSEIYPKAENELSFREVTTTVNKLWITDSNPIKRKAIHQIDTALTDAMQLLGVEKSDNLPRFLIVTDAEMQSNAIAAYRAYDNVMFIRNVAGDTQKLLELQKDCACPKNRLSTFLHELIHWQDAMKYRKKHGKIDQYFFERLRRYCHKQLASLSRAEYNNISEYGFQQLRKELFEEPFTEYRVWCIIKKGLQ